MFATAACATILNYYLDRRCHLHIYKMQVTSKLIEIVPYVQLATIGLRGCKKKPRIRNERLSPSFILQIGKFSSENILSFLLSEFPRSQYKRAGNFKKISVVLYPIFLYTLTRSSTDQSEIENRSQNRNTYMCPFFFASFSLQRICTEECCKVYSSVLQLCQSLTQKARKQYKKL